MNKEETKKISKSAKIISDLFFRSHSESMKFLKSQSNVARNSMQENTYFYCEVIGNLGSSETHGITEFL